MKLIAFLLMCILLIHFCSSFQPGKGTPPIARLQNVDIPMSCKTFMETFNRIRGNRPDDNKNLKAFFNSNNLRLPPKRLLSEDVKKELKERLFSHGVGRISYYDASNYQKAFLYFSAAFMGDELELIPGQKEVEETEWKDLFKAILRNDQDVMNRLKKGLCYRCSKGEGVSPSFPFDTDFQKEINPLRKFVEKAKPINQLYLRSKSYYNFSNFEPIMVLNETELLCRMVQNGPVCYTASLMCLHSHNRKWRHPERPYETFPDDHAFENHLDRRMFINNVLHNKGYSAGIFLHVLYFRTTSNRLSLCEHRYDLDPKEIHLDMKQFGAALVVGFHVEDEFLEKDKFFYSGTATFDRDENGRPIAESHSMVLVGAGNFEFEGKIDYCLLLQNNYRDKQYVLVTLEYFKSCKGILGFPTGEIHVGPENDLVEVGDRIIETTNMGGDTTESLCYTGFDPLDKTWIPLKRNEGM